MVKLYYSLAIIEIDKKINEDIKNILFENYNISKNYDILFIYISPIISTFYKYLAFFIFLILLIPINSHSYEKLKKYLK